MPVFSYRINERSTFLSCSNLEYIKLPIKLSAIEIGAFSGCVSLKEIHSYADIAPKISDNVFANSVKTNCFLYIPDVSLDSYKNAFEWKEFENINIKNYLSAKVSSSYGCDELKSGYISIYGAIGGSGIFEYRLNEENWSSKWDYNDLTPGVYEVFIRDAKDSINIIYLGIFEILKTSYIRFTTIVTPESNYGTNDGSIFIDMVW